MCVSAAPASFQRTTVYAGESEHDGRVVHVLGYENTAQNDVRRQSHAALWRRLFSARVAHPLATGNAMLLHFPAVPGSMTQANVLNTDGCTHILSDMVRALEPPRRRAPTGIPPAVSPAKAVHVFESGIYTVVLATDAREIPAAMDSVALEKRPPLNRRLFDWYHETFPEWPVAVCCFDNRDAIRATPMLWWYEPRYPQYLFAPGIDSHTGEIPQLGHHVGVDHWVVYGSFRFRGGSTVHYSDADSAKVRSYLPDRVVGKHLWQGMPNADFVAPIEALTSDGFQCERRLLSAAGE